MKVYAPGLAATGVVRLIKPADVLTCIEQFKAEGGQAPAVIIIAAPLLNPCQGHPAFQQKYSLVAPGFLSLAKELEGQDLFIKGEAGVLGWEVRVGAGGATPLVVSDSPHQHQRVTSSAVEASMKAVEHDAGGGVVSDDTINNFGTAVKAGRPRVNIPVGVLAGPGSIREKARAAGVSKSTIARAMQGELGL